MSIKQLKEEALKLIDLYPKKAEEIRGYYFLAQDEIEEGGSEDHECELAYNDMLECVKED